MRARGLIALAVIAACRSNTPAQPSGVQTPGSGTQTPGSGTQTTGSGTQITGSGTQTTGSGTQTTGSGTQTGSVFEGRPIAPTMSYLGADWLERPDRDEREQPDKVLDALALTRDMTAADVGAGTGYFTVRLARRVAHVHATDLQPQMLEMLKTRLAREHLSNVELHRGTDSDVALPASCCDLVLLVDVYHELSDPPAILAGIRRALKDKGRLVLVEYRGEDPDVPIKPEHKMTLPQIRKELEARGFRFVTSLEMLPDQRVVIFTATGS